MRPGRDSVVIAIWQWAGKGGSLFGGVLTLVLIQFRKLPLPGPLARQPWIMRLHETGGGIPYGIALAAAALAVYPRTGWMPAFGI